MFESFLKPPVSFPTLTGSIVTFNAQYALPLKSHKIALTATQSGSGTPSPDNVRTINGYSALNVSATGKNLVKYPYQTITNIWNGMSVVENNGVLTIEGTQNGVGSFVFGEVNLKKNITYTLSPFYDYLSGNELYMNLTLYDFNNNILVKNLNLNSGSFTVNNDCTARMYLNPSSSANGKYFHFTVSPQIEVGNGTSYTLYNGTTTTINLGSTVYGGEYDARTGVLTVTHKIVEMSSVSYNVGFGGYYTGYYANTIKLPDTAANSDLTCSCFAVGNTIGGDNLFIQPIGSSYAGYIIILPSATYQDANAFRNSLQGQYLVYPLKNPTQIQLPPCPIDTLEVNNIWADTGNTTLQYPKFG